MPKLISIGELIDQSWEQYRARLPEFLTISGWILITAILYAIALAFYPSASTLQLGAGLTSLESAGVVLFSATSLVVTPIISFWIYVALAKASSAYIARRSMTAREALRETRASFFPSLLTSVLVMLMIVWAIVIGFAPAAIVAALGILTIFGPLIILANLLLVAGIFVALFLSVKWVVYYFFAPYVTMLDAIPGKLALETSRQMIVGRFWSVLIRIVVPKLVFIIFGVFAMSIIAYIVGILIDASTGLNLDVQLRISTMTSTIVPILIAALINPLIVISDVLLLRSLRG